MSLHLGIKISTKVSSHMLDCFRAIAARNRQYLPQGVLSAELYKRIHRRDIKKAVSAS